MTNAWVPPVQSGFGDDRNARLTYASLAGFIKAKYAGLADTQTFTGANTFSGATTLSGTTAISGAATLSGATTTISSAATNLSGTTTTVSGVANLTGGLQIAGVAGKVLVMSGSAALGASYTTTTTQTNLTGMTTGALSCLAGDVVFLFGTWDMQNSAAGSELIGSFFNGTVNVGALPVFKNGSATAFRSVQSSFAIVPILSNSTQTYTMTAKHNTAAGTIALTQTTFGWMVFR